MEGSLIFTQKTRVQFPLTLPSLWTTLNARRNNGKTERSGSPIWGHSANGETSDLHSEDGSSILPASTIS